MQCCLNQVYPPSSNGCSVNGIPLLEQTLDYKVCDTCAPSVPKDGTEANCLFRGCSALDCLPKIGESMRTTMQRVASKNSGGTAQFNRFQYPTMPNNIPEAALIGSSAPQCYSYCLHMDNLIVRSVKMEGECFPDKETGAQCWIYKVRYETQANEFMFPSRPNPYLVGPDDIEPPFLGPFTDNDGDCCTEQFTCNPEYNYYIHSPTVVSRIQDPRTWCAYVSASDQQKRERPARRVQFLGYGTKKLWDVPESTPGLEVCPAPLEHNTCIRTRLLTLDATDIKTCELQGGIWDADAGTCAMTAEACVARGGVSTGDACILQTCEVVSGPCGDGCETSCKEACAQGCIEACEEGDEECVEICRSICDDYCEDVCSQSECDSPTLCVEGKQSCFLDRPDYGSFSNKCHAQKYGEVMQQPMNSAGSRFPRQMPEDEWTSRVCIEFAVPAYCDIDHLIQNAINCKGVTISLPHKCFQLTARPRQLKVSGFRQKPSVSKCVIGFPSCADNGSSLWPSATLINGIPNYVLGDVLGPTGIADDCRNTYWIAQLCFEKRACGFIEDYLDEGAFYCAECPDQPAGQCKGLEPYKIGNSHTTKGLLCNGEKLGSSTPQQVGEYCWLRYGQVASDEPFQVIRNILTQFCVGFEISNAGQAPVGGYPVNGDLNND